MPLSYPTGTWLTVAEIARHLRVSPMSVYRIISRGELPAIRIGKSLRVKRSDFTAYVAKHMTGCHVIDEV